MNVIYLSTGCSPDTYAALFPTSATAPSPPMQRFNELMVRGLSTKDVRAVVVSARPISRTSHPTSRCFSAYTDSLGSVRFHYIQLLNIRYLKALSVFLTSGSYTLAQSIRRRRATVIMVETLHLPLLVAAVLCGRVLGLPVIGIAPDVPGFFYEDEVGLKRSALARWHRWLIRRCSGLVAVSQPILDLFGFTSRDSVVVEGFSESSPLPQATDSEPTTETKIVLYAGTLDAANGIDMLVQGFCSSVMGLTALHLYGRGALSSEIKEISKRHEAVKYFGAVPNQVVLQAEARATLLIVPRPSHRRFVQYSFPSKLIEFMASGTPVLTTRLPVIPESLEPHLFFIEDETPQGILRAIQDVLSLPSTVLRQKGVEARRYIQEAMGESRQVDKILALASVQSTGMR